MYYLMMNENKNKEERDFLKEEKDFLKEEKSDIEKEISESF